MGVAYFKKFELSVNFRSVKISCVTSEMHLSQKDDKFIIVF